MRSYDEWAVIREFLEERLELMRARMSELAEEYAVKPSGSCRMDWQWLARFRAMLQTWVDEIDCL
jgi:hypothetical protein